MTVVPATVHPTAIIASDTSIGTDVTIGAFSIVGANVTIGDGSIVGSHCVLGDDDHGPLAIGSNAVIRSHTVIYGGSTFGDELETGHRVMIRERQRAGRNLRVGTGSDLQGSGAIGDCVRIHSDVFIAQATTIGDFVWIFPKVMLADDPHPPSDSCTVGPTLKATCAIGASSVVLPGVTIGNGGVVGAGSIVTRDVEPATLVLGNPARPIGPTSRVECSHGNLDGPVYPWWLHLQRGYPADVDFTIDGPALRPGDGSSART